jgi:hypothetical protein
VTGDVGLVAGGGGLVAGDGGRAGLAVRTN